jgi:hypothetical protein
MNFKPLFRSILLITILLPASLACNAVTNIFFWEPPVAYTPGAPLPADPQPEPTSEALTCPLVTDKILEAATRYDEADSSEANSEEPEHLYLVTYSVSGDRISAPYYEEVPANLAGFQEDISGHKEIWNYFVTLIPSVERSSLAEYSIVTDGEGNILAAVAQTIHDPAQWGLEVDIRDSDDKLNLTYTLIHEYAHLMTLGPGQVTPSQAVFDHPDDDDIYLEEVSACPDYFPGEGCSGADSYINAFFDAFWTDIYEQWQDINLIENDDGYYEALDDFHSKYEERFVSNYAATNPEEDIAEAFTFFVLSSRPNGDTIAEQKILFFYRYPELIHLRAEILRGVCQIDQ